MLTKIPVSDRQAVPPLSTVGQSSASSMSSTESFDLERSVDSLNLDQPLSPLTSLDSCFPSPISDLTSLPDVEMDESQSELLSSGGLLSERQSVYLSFWTFMTAC